MGLDYDVARPESIKAMLMCDGRRLPVHGATWGALSRQNVAPQFLCASQQDVARAPHVTYHTQQQPPKNQPAFQQYNSR
jgi:hypothetical protein